MIPESVPPAPAIETPICYEQLALADVIGSGGNAIVRRATVGETNTTSPITVAVKEPYLHDDVPTEIIDRFRTEADTWRRLDDHDHIVTVYDWDIDPHPWIALEYMDAGSLRDRLKNNDITPAHALWLGTTLADAVHHAHRHGVAHLDLKPANILFRTVEAAWAVPKITDWGLAQLLIERSASLEGLSPHYAAPEQFDPDTFGQPDDRTDIYQLGVVLYELLDGQRPFTGRGKYLMRAVLNEPPLAPTSTTTGLPTGVDVVLGRALAKRKHDRYETVADLRRDLETLYTAIQTKHEEFPAQLIATQPPPGATTAPGSSQRLPVPSTGYAAAIELKDEGFVALGPGYFERHDPVPDRGWRTGFQLADVRAGIPAERHGHDHNIASQELFDRLSAGETQLVVGRAGAGKSTLCKQVAVRWDDDPETGPVYYRESGHGRHFESTASLKATIARAERHVLVVVEDAVRPATEAILDLIKTHDSAEVSFLLDARDEDLDTFERRESAASAVRRQRVDVLQSVTRYRLLPLSEADVQRVIDAFEMATGREVGRPAAALHEEVRTETDFGEMLLLGYLLPVGGDEGATTGLEAHVARRYQSLLTPEDVDVDVDAGEGEDAAALRKLSRFDADLVADVGVMVNLLNASGIGIHPELVHALGHGYGHDLQTHDAIAEIRATLDGWVLFPAKDDSEGAELRTTHKLWSTLFLRNLAREYKTRQTGDRRRPRSEPRTSRCLAALFAVADDSEHRAVLREEFPGSPLLTDAEAAPAEMAAESVEAVFDLGERWPVLAPLFGTTETARYDLPATLPPTQRHQAMLTRGHAHREHGAYANARTDYETALEQARNANDRESEAASLDNLGIIAKEQGAYEEAREYHQRSLDITREIGDRHREAETLTNLGNVARMQRTYEEARKLQQRSLEIRQDIGDRRGEAANLGNLGLLASEQGAYEQAREYLQRSLNINRDLGARYGEAKNLNNLGNITFWQGAYEEAREYHQRSLEIRQDIGVRHDEAASLGNLGNVALQQGDFEEAYEYFQRSLDIARDIDARDYEAKNLLNLGIVAKEQGVYEEAREYLQRSLDITRDIGDRRDEAVSLNGLGNVAHDQGAYEEARKYYQQSLDIFEDIGDRRDEAVSLNGLGNVAHDQGAYEEAREYHQRSLDIRQNIGARRGETESLTSLGIVAREQDDLAIAQDYLDRSLKISRDIGYRHQEAENLRALGMVTKDCGDTEDAIERYEDARQLFEEIGAVADELMTLAALVELARDTGRPEAAREHCETARHRLEAASDLPAGVRKDLADLCDSSHHEE